MEVTMVVLLGDSTAELMVPKKDAELVVSMAE